MIVVEGHYLQFDDPKNRTQQLRWLIQLVLDFFRHGSVQLPLVYKLAQGDLSGCQMAICCICCFFLVWMMCEQRQFMTILSYKGSPQTEISCQHRMAAFRFHDYTHYWIHGSRLFLPHIPAKKTAMCYYFIHICQHFAKIPYPFAVLLKYSKASIMCFFWASPWPR